jgi:hypothetical protein
MKLFKIDLQLFAEEGEEVKTFTQEDVDRIVQERLARVKKETPEDYTDLKEIEKTLEEFGYVGTAAEKKAAIKAYREEIKQQQELERLQQTAEEDGITPALAKKIKDLEDKLEKSTKVIEEITGEKQKAKADAEAKAKADEEWEKQVTEMNEAHPDIDLEELAKNAKFTKFIKGKGLPLKELYEDFVEFVGETEAEAIIKVKSKDIRSTSSGKGNNSEGNSYGLSAEEKALVDEHNRRYPKSKMSYKEYSESKRN